MANVQRKACSLDKLGRKPNGWWQQREGSDEQRKYEPVQKVERSPSLPSRFPGPGFSQTQAVGCPTDHKFVTAKAIVGYGIVAYDYLSRYKCLNVELSVKGVQGPVVASEGALPDCRAARSSRLSRTMTAYRKCHVDRQVHSLLAETHPGSASNSELPS